MPKNPTIKDIAAMAGVSLGTVSNYLNGTKNVAGETRIRIDQAVEQTGWVPNRAIRTLHGNRTHTLALLVPDAANPFFTEVARGVEEVAQANGLVLVYCDTAGDSVRESAYIRTLAEMRVGGAILSTTNKSLPNLRDLTSLKTPLVTLGENDGSLSSVTFDQRLAGFLSMKHLLDLGHSSFLFAGGPGGEGVLAARQLGAMDALTAAGMDPALLRRTDAAGRTVRERSALASMIMESHPRPTAVICGNDLIAIAIVNRLVREGWQVPEDLAVIGHDDIDEAQLATVPLTTIRQPAYEMGIAAATALFAEAHADTITTTAFEPLLQIRQSTVAPLPAG